MCLIALWFWDDSPYYQKKTWFSVGLWGYNHAPSCTQKGGFQYIYVYIGCHSVCWWSTYFNFMFIMFLPFWGPLQPTTGIIDPFFFCHRKLPASLCLVPGCDVSSIGGPRIGCHHFSGRLHRTRSNYVV